MAFLEPELLPDVSAYPFQQDFTEKDVMRVRVFPQMMALQLLRGIPKLDPSLQTRVCGHLFQPYKYTPAHLYSLRARGTRHEGYENDDLEGRRVSEFKPVGDGYERIEFTLPSIRPKPDPTRPPILKRLHRTGCEELEDYVLGIFEAREKLANYLRVQDKFREVST